MIERGGVHCDLLVQDNMVQLIYKCLHVTTLLCGRRGDLIVSVLVPGASGPGSSPARGHGVVILGKTLDSHSASLHPGV